MEDAIGAGYAEHEDAAPQGIRLDVMVSIKTEAAGLSEWELWACATETLKQHGQGALGFVAERIGLWRWTETPRAPKPGNALRTSWTSSAGDQHLCSDGGSDRAHCPSGSSPDRPDQCRDGGYKLGDPTSADVSIISMFDSISLSRSSSPIWFAVGKMKRMPGARALILCYIIFGLLRR